MNEIVALSRTDLQSLMQFGGYVDVVAEAFRMQAVGRHYVVVNRPWAAAFENISMRTNR
jgi:hypothetical protein